MTPKVADQALLTLNVPPALEESVVDWLLEQSGSRGFTSQRVSGHGADHDALTAAEQVSGRQRRLQFQIQMKSADVEALLAAAGRRFAGADIHFWVLPVVAGGALDAASAAGSIPTDDGAQE